ncbi:MAG: hypothetical protein JJU29_22915 [Verrucomicrobia bacterium]|nr:hypothetical protein [Verrucomicrobiota bacterium]MCH8514520.1 hypothetical protein [Kiritimatiellia bacterium]
MNTATEVLGFEQSAQSLGDGPVRFNGHALYTETVVEKEGYWRTQYLDRWTESVDGDAIWYFPKTRKDISIVLNQMRNPRPLYAHRVNGVRLPEMEEEYGFDLEVGDLVAPHGGGEQADLIFKVTGELNDETNEYDVVMTISFPNEGDGILPVSPTLLGESQLLLGQEAPEEGYQPTFELHQSVKSGVWFLNRKTSPTDDEGKRLEGFWFRTHTELDPETGEVIRARHGKIYANRNRVIPTGFSLDAPRPKMGWETEFTYFYAPDHTRSLESNGETLVPYGNLGGVDKR